MNAKKFYLSLYLYSGRDGSLLALRECNVSFSELVRKALYYHVRGSKLNIFVNGCFAYKYRDNLEHAYVKDVILIEDAESARFLRRFPVPWQRMATVRTILNEALVRPLYGAFYDDSRLIKVENEIISRIDLDRYKNLIICSPPSDNMKAVRKPKVIRPVEGLTPIIPDEWYETPDPAGAEQQGEKRKRKKRKRKNRNRKDPNTTKAGKSGAIRFGFSEDELAAPPEHSGEDRPRQDTVVSDDDFMLPDGSVY